MGSTAAEREMSTPPTLQTGAWSTFFSYNAAADDDDDVCCVSQNAEIRFNFGDTPFKYPPKVHLIL